MQVAKSPGGSALFHFFPWDLKLKSCTSTEKYRKMQEKQHTKFQAKINYSSAIQPFRWWQHEINLVITVLQGLCLVLFDRMSTSIPPHRSIFVATLVDLQNYWQNTGPSRIVLKETGPFADPFLDDFLRWRFGARGRPIRTSAGPNLPGLSSGSSFWSCQKWCSIVPRHIFYKTVLEALWNTSYTIIRDLPGFRKTTKF